MWKRLKNIFSRKPAQINSQFSNRLILTIDDDLTQRTMIERTLQKAGLKVLTAENGERGLEAARSQNPDAILLDVIMPGIRGSEVCRRLKSDNRTKNIPVIFLTSTDDPKDVIEQYELGAEIHLTKPINPKELIRQIEITLGSQ